MTTAAVINVQNMDNIALAIIITDMAIGVISTSSYYT